MGRKAREGRRGRKGGKKGEGKREGEEDTNNDSHDNKMFLRISNYEYLPAIMLVSSFCYSCVFISMLMFEPGKHSVTELIIQMTSLLHRVIKRSF